MNNAILASFGVVPDSLDDQRGVLSWAFEPFLELHHRAAIAALQPVLDSLRDYWMEGFQRKPNTQRQGNFVACLRVILLNLMRVRTINAELTVGIPSGKQRLDKERRYLPDFMTVRYHPAALKLLQERGLVSMIKAGHKQEDFAETARYALSEASCNLLPMSLLTVRDFTIGRRDEVIMLKDSAGRLAPYDDTTETRSMRARLHRLNELLEGTDITMARPSNLRSGVKDRYTGQRTDLYRVFNNGSFHQGGRFYGGWWQLAKKEQRPFITIDGKRTVEADFKGLHPAILFAKNGLPIPNDPYAFVPGIAENKTLRGHAKTTFLALLNAGKGETAEPRDFDSEAHGMTADAFRLMVKDAFPMLPGIFGTGIGLRLQREESNLAERIMLHFADREVPVLPVHDSFIIAEQHKDELVSVMVGAFHDAYGQIPPVNLVPTA